MAKSKKIKPGENDSVQKIITDNGNQKIEKIYANFWQRLCAFIIDMFLISLVTSLITQPFIHSNNLQTLSNEVIDTLEQYQKKKIDINTYINRTVDISYDMARERGLSTIIEIAISIFYFVVYQFKCGGQTIGKKLLKIRVVKKDDSNLTMNNILFRSLIIDSILVDIIVLCLSIFVNKDIYFYGVGIVQLIQYIVIFVSCLIILSRKDRQGIHDMVANTEVVVS
ncbi:MAG: RDD family protein [Bacilli bacterium]|nr:RDD family protein [Bacilli bacterium]